MAESRAQTGPQREAIYDLLRDRIVQGKLTPEYRLAEEALAKEFGTSRTPIRETLFRLEREGLVSSRPNCGFSVAALSAREIREVYPILAALESLALRTSGILAQTALGELSKWNAALVSAAGDPAAEIAADANWHEALLKRCPNARLRESINNLRPLTFRYEYAYRQQAGQTRISIDQHEAIAQEIGRGNFETAAKHLEENWLFNQKWLLLWAGETP